MKIEPTHTINSRHNNMSAIHSKNTSIELLLRKALWAKGYRYRINYNKLPGRPDIVFTKYKIAIFCDSEFFHGKNWDQLKQRISSGKNPAYWYAKIERNIQRDMENDHQLALDGWIVIHFWGDEIKHDINHCLCVIEDAIQESMSCIYNKEV